jgi:hypothetical protein
VPRIGWFGSPQREPGGARCGHRLLEQDVSRGPVSDRDDVERLVEEGVRTDRGLLELLHNRALLRQRASVITHV